MLLEYKKGEVICKRGSLATHIIFLESGLAKIFLEDGVNTLVLKILPEKNLIGLATVSDEINTFEYSVMAYVDSVIRQIEINVFKKLLKQNAAFAKEVIDIISANSVQIYSRFFCLTHKQSFGRLADIILCLSDRVFKSDAFELPLSRKDLAELSGLSAENVIRMLKKFREEGLVDVEGKRLKVCVHRKGATPAGAGVMGIIPGSMAAPGYVVRGLGVEASLNSASHGAGRRMSRTRAKEQFTWDVARRYLKDRGVTLISAGLDEVPMAYKDIDEVMAAQRDLVEPLARFDPRLGKMAPAGEPPED